MIVSPHGEAVKPDKSEGNKGCIVAFIEGGAWGFVVKNVPLSTYVLFRYPGLLKNMGQVCTPFDSGTNSTFRLSGGILPAERGVLRIFSPVLK